MLSNTPSVCQPSYTDTGTEDPIVKCWYVVSLSKCTLNGKHGCTLKLMSRMSTAVCSDNQLQVAHYVAVTAATQ